MADSTPHPAEIAGALPPDRKALRAIMDGNPPTGALHLSLSLNVDVAELETWPPATARAFMLGVAQCISAQRDPLGGLR